MGNILVRKGYDEAAKDYLKMDKVIISGLKLNCIIGINKWERSKKQPVIIDITLYTNISASANTDNINDTVNYKELYDLIVELVKQSKFHLIEALAQNIVKTCLKNHKIKKVKVKVTKPKALELAESAGVEIIRKNVHHV